MCGYPYKNKQAFTLVELAVVLVILSVIVGSIIGILPSIQQSNNTTAMKEKLDKIQAAINIFYSQNGYIPCAARIDDAPASANFGVATDCSLASVAGTTEIAGATTNEDLRIGVVPTRTLNIPDEYMFDAWNSRIKYVSVKNLSQSTALFGAYTSAQSDIIRIEDAGANRIPQANSTTYPNVVAYVVISTGPNNKGATNYLGTITPVVSCSGGKDVENCDDDITFVDAFYDNSAGNFNDDFIRWKTQQQILAETSYSGFGGTSLGKHAIFTESYVVGTLVPYALIRALNTTVHNDLSSASINVGTSQITLGSGTYRFKAWSVSYGIGESNLQLYNDTDATMISSGIVSNDVPVFGCCPAVANGIYTLNQVSGRFTLATSKVITLRQASYQPMIFMGVQYPAYANGFSSALAAGQLGNNIIYSYLELWEE